MIFGYARVSTDNQTTDRQIDALNKYGVDKIFEDKITGTVRNRPQLDLLLNKLRAGDTLVIYDLTRLGRNTKQLLALAEEFKEEGIGLVSITENLDTTTSTGQFIFTILCAVAQLDRDMIVENTKTGLQAAKSRGRKLGKPPVNPKIVEKALRMYDSGEYSSREISEITGIHKTTIYRYIAKRKENENGT